MDVFRSLYAILSRRRRQQLVLSFVFMIVAAVIEMAMVGVAVQFLGAVTGVAAPGRFLLHWVAGTGSWERHTALFGGLFVAVALLTALARLLITWFTLSFSNTIGLDLSSQLWARILHQSYPDYLARNSSMVLGGLEKVRPAIFNVVQPAIQGLAAGVVMLLLAGLLILIDYRAAAVIGTVTISIYVVASLLARRRLRRNSLLSAAGINARTKLVQEGLGGFRDILLARSQGVFQARLHDIERQQRDAAVSTAVITAFPRFFAEAGAIAGIVLIIMIAARYPGGMATAIPVLGAFALGGQRLLLTAQQTFVGWSQARGNAALLADVVALIRGYDRPAAARTGDPAQARIATPKSPAPDPLPARLPATTIRLDGVSFAYVPGRPVLRDIDLTIRAGERIGVIGASGSGKSTLLDIVMGLLEPGGGRLTIDGEALDAAGCRAWQARLAHVPQHIYLADDSIAANIAFGVEAEAIDRDRVRTAAAHAGIADVVTGLPDGFATLVGERGVRLSGGQRQRIGIARALYRCPEVLILDEATSALDDATEARVLAALAAARRGLTLIVVAHRQSSLAICDRIVRIDGGAIRQSNGDERIDARNSGA